MQIFEKNIGIIYGFDYFSCNVRKVLDWIEKNPQTLLVLERCVRGKHGYFLEDASILNLEETVYGLKMEWEVKKQYRAAGYWSRNGNLRGYVAANIINGKLREGKVWNSYIWYKSSHFKRHWWSENSKAWRAIGLEPMDNYHLDKASALLFLKKQLAIKMSRAERKRKGLTI